MWANGHTDLTKMGVAYKTIKNDLKKGGDAALRARLKKYRAWFNKPERSYS